MSSVCVATILEWINLSYNASSYATRGSLGASRENTLRPDLPRAKLFIVTEPQIRTVLTVLLANFSLSLQPRQVHRGEAMPRPSRISPALSASMATPIGLVRPVFYGAESITVRKRPSMSRAAGKSGVTTVPRKRPQARALVGR